MIGKSKTHDRKLGLIGAYMVMARFKADEMRAMRQVNDEIEAMMVNSGYLNKAPFLWITLSLRFVLKNEVVPHYQRINEAYGDLPLGIELDTHELCDADQNELTDRFRIATLKALVDAGMRYNLPYERFAEMLAAGRGQAPT